MAVVRSLRGLVLRLSPGSAPGENAHQIAGQDGVAVVVPTVEFGREQRRAPGGPTNDDPQVEPVAAPYDVWAAIDAYQTVDPGDYFDEIAVDEDDASLQEGRDAVVAAEVDHHRYEELTVRATGLRGRRGVTGVRSAREQAQPYEGKVKLLHRTSHGSA